MARSFLTGEEISPPELAGLVERASELKALRSSPDPPRPLAGRSIALIFEQPSTRTRVSFEVGVFELGGHPVVLRGDEMQLTRGESVSDTARALSRFVAAIVARTSSDEVLAELADAADIPVINGLTRLNHPCQAVADLLTLHERFGRLEGLVVAYVGDGNNVARSLAVLGSRAGVEVRVATPEGYELEPGIAALDTHDPREAAAGADALYTDVWSSIGQDAEADQRRADLEPYRLDADLLGAADDRAVVMHCLPAHPGEEISADVLYGNRSVVWDQAENRLHAHKALLELFV